MNESERVSQFMDRDLQNALMKPRDVLGSRTQRLPQSRQRNDCEATRQPRLPEDIVETGRVCIAVNDADDASCVGPVVPFQLLEHSVTEVLVS
ncbi:MAG: hypothetical protein QOI24_2369 [Acidobacteriota bacterium]|nr:hypothetical protein [Acidobacteriota bacterium]